MSKQALKQTDHISSTNAFLFAWNPNKWKWTTLGQSIEQLENSGKVTERWSCVSYRAIKPGDRAFLVRLGSEPKGIFAAGYVTSEPFLSKHWIEEDKDIYRVFIDFEVLLNPENESILSLDDLKNGNLIKQDWTPQSSGVSIKTEVIEELEEVWFGFLAKKDTNIDKYIVNEKRSDNKYTEGKISQIIQNRRERNPHARKACIEHYGYSCAVCEFKFEHRYGEIGKDFIHVHHLTQVSSNANPYEVDPIKDLRPVCPNCHAMLHKQNPPLSIEELKLHLT